MSVSGRKPRDAAQDLPEFCCGDRSPEQVPLGALTPLRPQEGELFLGLDTLGHHLEADAVG